MSCGFIKMEVTLFIPKGRIVNHIMMRIHRDLIDSKRYGGRHNVLKTSQRKAKPIAIKQDIKRMVQLLFDFNLMQRKEFRILFVSALLFPMGFNIPLVYSTGKTIDRLNLIRHSIALCLRVRAIATATRALLSN